jgi:hypothetical protein
MVMHLENQEGEEGMKYIRHNKELGTIAGCTVRPMEAFLLSKGFIGAPWFSSILTVSELSLCGFEVVMHIK